jgi:prepilin-type N-terminal cleavage/methylation domain-containing protein
MSRPKPRVCAAFTLVEIMIAIGIFGMVMAAIYSTWSAVLRGSKAGLNAAAEAQRSRIAISALETALAGCEMFEANLRYYSFITDTSSDFAYLSLTSKLPASFPGSGLFGDQTLRRVTFTVESGQNSRNDLVMYQTPLLAITNADRPAIPITLARNVSLFGLEFWDTNRAEWAQEWLPTNQLPKMMRVSLVFGGAPNSLSTSGKEVATRVVLLSSSAVPRQMQLPGAAGTAGRGGVGTTQPPPGSGGRGGRGSTVNPGGRRGPSP